MKSSRLITLVVLLFISCSIHSQSLVNSTGNTISSQDYIVEYSIGEISITTIEDPSTPKAYFLTQGLLQPVIKIDNPDCNIINDSLSYFPTPTRSFLTIVSRYDWIKGYRIYAADGKLVRVSPLINNQINLSDLAAAVYFIKLFPGCNNNYRILKVIKQ